MEIETRHLVLGVHLFVAAGLGALAAALLAAGELAQGALRAAMALAAAGVGVYLFRLRADR